MLHVDKSAFGTTVRAAINIKDSMAMLRMEIVFPMATVSDWLLKFLRRIHVLAVRNVDNSSCKGQ